MAEGYQVLARKWRPQRFDEMVGQEAVVRTLVNALKQNRIAHAYCFSGIRGVGKTTVARLLAKGLNCHAVQEPTAEPCGQCPSCREIEESRSLDVVELDAASRTGVDDMRQLTEVSRYAPSRDRYRVFIIDEAHMLSASAFNALLKTLEEPPPRVVFVLATTEPNKILPTVLSRCQHYAFGRIGQGLIAEHLARIAQAEGVEISEDALALVAAAADGSLRDAQSLLDKLIAFAGAQIDERTVLELLGLVDRVLLFRAVDLIAAGDVAGVIALVDEMVEGGVDLHQFAIDLLGHFRNLLVVRSVPTPGDVLHLPAGEIARLREQAERFTIEDLDRAFNLIAGSEYRIKLAEQPRYHLEIVLARLARMPSLVPLEQLIARLQGQEASGPEPGGGGDAPGARGRGRAAPASPPAPPEQAAPARPGARRSIPPSGQGAAKRRAGAPARVSGGIPTAVATAENEPASPAAGTGTLLTRLQERLERASPLIGNVLARASGVVVREDLLAIRFPASAAIFAERVRDPRLLPEVAAAACEVLGRTVRVRVELEEADGAATATVAGGASPAAAQPGTRRPPVPSSPRAAAPSAPPADPMGGECANAASPTDGEHAGADPLRARVESEPHVQEFLAALRGQIISVEEI